MDQTSRRPAHQNLLKQTKIEPTKKKKKMNQQKVKVVHFSNPVRVTTTAADFRALVQELTGRDSQIADLLAGHPPATVGGVCDSYSPLDLLARGGLDQAAIFDFPPPDFKAESRYGDGDRFELYGEAFESVEDYDGVLMESVVFETPVIAGDGLYGWAL
ncbi:hypothetical protein M5K25_019785 [Dendrobium thyrsiflorum]|uniref:VQ domain-containing protein n=1 Tax=Dendrobium thyrsiflorum TaxID=117978 RepID=A0ABD0UMS2_DENTH